MTIRDHTSFAGNAAGIDPHDCGDGDSVPLHSLYLSELEFTRDESRALDTQAKRLRHPDRPALRPDPALWEAFAEDRAPKPRRRPSTASAVPLTPSHCIGGCGKPLRRHRDPVAEHPGTVRHYGKGVCKTCANKRREARTTPTTSKETQ